MSWSKYAEFLAFAMVLVVIPRAGFRRGDQEHPGRRAPAGGDGRGWACPAPTWRQGFISNITNPKVLVFYLAVLPQFLTPGAGLGWLLVLAWSHAVLSLTYLLVLVTGLHSSHRLLMRRRIRRTLDATTGAVLLGFGAKLATEHV
jgi:threonine/homoserine/homoserine lactone efflux protein